MVNLRHTQDIEVLRQVALLQEAELRRMHDKLSKTLRENLRLKGQTDAEMQQQLIALQEQLAAQQKLLYGDSSEKRSHPERAPAEPSRVPAQPRRGHGPTPQPRLVRDEKLHDLDEADKQCVKCGGDLAEMKGEFESFEEVTVVERSYRLVTHKRKKYRCGCNGHIETALGPTKLIPGGRYSLDFAIQVAIDKYLDHLPLERQVRAMKRSGLEVSSQTLFDQIDALADKLHGVYERIITHVLSHPVIGADETVWRMLNERGESMKTTKRWYAWAACCETAVGYRIDPSRSAEAAGKLLGDYQGTVLTDGYAAYGALSRLTAERTGTGFKQGFCWSHVRRKFIAAESSHKREASGVIALIDELFAIERDCKTGPPPSFDGDAEAWTKHLRSERAVPVVAALEVWGKTKVALPSSSFGKAQAYMNDLWQGLTRFIDEPRLGIDNNATERAMRGLVIGRKNHYGSKSLRGTEVAAVLYSVFETLKLVGVDPLEYLRYATTAAVNGDAPVLPHEFAATMPT